MKEDTKVVFYTKAMIEAFKLLERRYYGYFKSILNENEPKYDESSSKILSLFNVRVENTGESMDNILKVYYLKKHHPDIALFVQTSPAFCCPSIVTEAMTKRIEKTINTPVVSITYDGTEGHKNRILLPYLKYTKTEREIELSDTGTEKSPKSA